MGNWIESYYSRIKELPVDTNAIDGNFFCPCCHMPTLGERAVFEICLMCGWEDDGQDSEHANEVWGGPNGGYSLDSARDNFLTYMTMYSPSDEPSFKRTTTRNDLKIVLADIYTRILDENDEFRRVSLWNQAAVIEKKLF